MAETWIWRASRVSASGDRASVADGTNGRDRRAGLRLWTLLNAQALIDGVAFIEDDRRRMRS
jgi:hypothetical protein